VERENFKKAVFKVYRSKKMNLQLISSSTNNANEHRDTAKLAPAVVSRTGKIIKNIITIKLIKPELSLNGALHLTL